jgi:outer membrane immunogenic protein
MKKFLLGSVALAAMLAGPAMAADMPVKVKAPPPVVYYDWSGLYVGFNIGGTWYDQTINFPNPPVATITNRDSDTIYGFHAGAQNQWGNWVLGIEVAYSACFRECRSLSAALPVALGFTPNTALEGKMTNLFTVGPRLGFTWDRWMIYATGGPAAATLKATYCSTLTGVCGPTFTTQSGQSTNWGWYAGGGLDYMIHRGALVDVIIGAEYQHFDVREKATFCANLSCNPPSALDYRMSSVGDLVRARLTIKTHGWDIFWGPPAVAAKY